jgi:hypothetical protein
VSWILAGYREIANSIKEEGGKREADEELCAKEQEPMLASASLNARTDLCWFGEERCYCKMEEVLYFEKVLVGCAKFISPKLASSSPLQKFLDRLFTSKFGNRR